MAAEEVRKAMAAYADFYERTGGYADAEDTFRGGWEAGVEEERERCAALAEDGRGGVGDAIARAIRAGDTPAASTPPG